jgi:hypothetical protein
LTLDKCPVCNENMRENNYGDFAPEYGWWDNQRLYCPKCHLFVSHPGSKSYTMPSGNGFVIHTKMNNISMDNFRDFGTYDIEEWVHEAELNNDQLKEILINIMLRLELTKDILWDCREGR